MELLDEPEESDIGNIITQFRLPRGQTKRRFLKFDKIYILHSYIKSLGREIAKESNSNDFIYISRIST